MIKIDHGLCPLTLANRWTIATSLRPGGDGGQNTVRTVVVRLRDSDGVIGWGESAPAARYAESIETSLALVRAIDPSRLSFDDLEASFRYLDEVAGPRASGRGAIEIALWDGAAQKAGKRVCDLLGVGFTEDRHVTSFSIGIDEPEVVRRKVEAARNYPILKLKVGGPRDRAALQALREVAPDTTVRVDGNEAWTDREEALRRIEELAADPHIEFVEQPMPADTPAADLAWLRDRSPLPILADESCRTVADIPHCAETFHGVNVKLAKTGGIDGALRTLRAAREAGLRTMLGCMIETSILITAAAHLADLTDHLDVDGNLLVTDDPFEGVECSRGRLSFRNADPTGLGVRLRHGHQPWA